MAGIGAEHGLTRERVRQIALAFGTTGRAARERRAIVASADAMRDAATAKLLVAAGVTPNEIRAAVGPAAARAANLSIRRSQPADPAARRARVVAELQARFPDGVTGVAQLPPTLRTRVYQEFPAMRDACQAAGIPCSVARAPQRRVDFVSQDDLAEAIADFLVDPTAGSAAYSAWNVWSKAHQIAGRCTLRSKFGSWTDALEAGRVLLRWRAADAIVQRPIAD